MRGLHRLIKEGFIMTIIRYCSCKHEYQDKRYGEGKRVMNPTKNDKYPYRCTVCGKGNSDK